jgi:hypothetical protein
MMKWHELLQACCAEQRPSIQVAIGMPDERDRFTTEKPRWHQHAETFAVPAIPISFPNPCFIRVNPWLTLFFLSTQYVDQNPGVISSTRWSSRSRKYKLVAPPGHVTVLSMTTPSDSSRCCQGTTSSVPIENAR